MTPSTVPSPLTVDAAGAAALVGVSRSYWMKMHAEGRIPDPLRLGRRVLWRVSDIEAWVANGCRRPTGGGRVKAAPHARPAPARLAIAPSPRKVSSPLPEAHDAS